MRRIILGLFLMLTVAAPLYAQQLKISGTVLDEYGHGLPGVNISTRNQTSSVASSINGQFEILAGLKDVLLFSYPNYQTQSVSLADSATIIIIRLVKASVQKNERTDVLYGSLPTDKITGAIATVYTGQLTTTPGPLYAYALGGRLPGLYSQQSRGWTTINNSSLVQQDVDGLYYPQSGTMGLKGPSDNTEINLRLRGQAPVTIIDGVQRDIYTIDPENIESVSVLKDGLSTILLGQKSSRGVILVTTKKPVQGTPHVSLTAQTGIQEPLGLPDPVNAYQYAYLYNEAQSNEGNPLSYTYEDFAAWKNHTDPYGHPDVNWFNTILKKNSLISRYSLNVSGGGNAARYAVGIGYLDDKGLFNGSNPQYNVNATLKRYTINSNIDVDVNKDFNVRLQLFARIQDGNQPGGGTDAIISQMYTTPNNAYPVFNPDGSFGGTQAYSKNLYAQLTRSGYVEDYTRDILSSLELNYKLDRFLKGLWAKVNTNLSVYASNTTNRSAGVPSFKLSVGSAGDTLYSRYGAASDQLNSFTLTYSAQFWYLQSVLGYTRQFGKHGINARLFYDRNESIFNYDLPETNQNIASTFSYDYDGKYLADLAINYSGNDRYPPGKQFGFFYAAGLGWNIARENFIKNNSGLSWINNLKLRATYAQNGNANTGYFTWRESFRINIVTPTYPIGINRASQSVAQQMLLANPNVTWEKAHKFNVGIDAALFKNRLLFTADYYRDKYYDLLQTRGRQVSLIGIDYPAENLGINRFSGTELSLTYQDNYKKLHYYITANASLENSKVIFSDEIQQKYAWNKVTGQPVGMQFGYIADGLVETQKEATSSPHVAGYTLQPGDIKYKDLNGDGTIDQYDATAIGSSKPMFYYGLSAGISAWGFDISVLLQGVSNRTYMMNDYSFGSGSNQAYTYTVGRWTPETGTAATYPRLTPGINASNDLWSTYWLRNGNYLRLKNAEIGYSLPYHLLSRLKLSAVRFFANGYNLLTHAAFDRVDPEVYGQVYPVQRIINFGVNVKF